MNELALITIVGMAIGTYCTRIGGYWLVSRFDLTPPIRAWLGYVPAAVLTALIVPELADGGPAEWAAGGAALVVAWRTGNILYAMIAGIAVVLGSRRLLGIG